MSDSDKSGSSELISRSEVLERRSKRLKKLIQVYSDHYWAIIEDLKSKHKQFYWNTAQSPFHHSSVDNNKCRTNGCKTKPMPLTNFCFTHILSDPNQILYKPCTYSLKSSPSGPIICMKPIVSSRVPSLCPQHLEKAERTLRIALKKRGYLNAITTSKISPKMNVLVAESIHQIQSKRRAAKNALLVDSTTSEA